MNSNLTQEQMEHPANSQSPHDGKSLRTETFYGVRYTKEEVDTIRQRIYDSKLMAAEWIRLC